MGEVVGPASALKNLVSFSAGRHVEVLETLENPWEGYFCTADLRIDSVIQTLPTLIYSFED